MTASGLTRRALLLAAASGVACSADAVPEPEPGLETPGSFVASGPVSDGGFVLLRSLMSLRLDNGNTLLFFTRYDVRPKSFEHARELCRTTSDFPAVAMLQSPLKSEFELTPFRVVWFRTLTQEERDVLG